MGGGRRSHGRRACPAAGAQQREHRHPWEPGHRPSATPGGGQQGLDVLCQCPGASKCGSAAASGKWACRPVGSVQLRHLLFQLLGLHRCKLEVAEVTTAVLLWVMVPQLSLQRIGPQEGVCHEGAGQAARGDVLPQLKAQEVPVGGQGRRPVRRGVEVPGKRRPPGHPAPVAQAIPLMSHPALAPGLGTATARGLTGPPSRGPRGVGPAGNPLNPGLKTAIHICTSLKS